MTNHEREVEILLLRLELLARGKKDPKSYMLGMCLGILAKLYFEDSNNAKIINASIKPKDLTPPK